MICDLLKILKTAVLFTPFYNIYGTLYINDNNIAAVKLTYTNAFGYNNFVVNYQEDFQKCIELQSSKVDYNIDIQKYSHKNGNTYIVNDKEAFQNLVPYNLSSLMTNYKMNQDKFKVSTYNLYELRDNYYNTGISKISYVPTKTFRYVKCTKSHLHLPGNKWPSSKFMGRIKSDNIVRKCFEKCSKRNFKYFGIDSGNICWCANNEPLIKNSDNCMKCSYDNSLSCGNVNYGFTSVYKIHTSYNVYNSQDINKCICHKSYMSNRTSNHSNHSNHSNETYSNNTYTHSNHSNNNSNNNTYTHSNETYSNNTSHYNDTHFLNVSGSVINSNRSSSARRNIIHLNITSISININNVNGNMKNMSNDDINKIIPINMGESIREVSYNSGKSNIYEGKFKTITNIAVFRTKLDKILNIIDNKLSVNETKKEIVDVWNNNDEDEEDD